MEKLTYSGRALTFEEQVDLLESRGLKVEDRSRALHILRNISYSRLRSYLVPLMEDRKTGKFKPGVKFEQSYIYYGFDRRLRELIFHELEKIEISIRASMAYASSEDNDGYWYLDPVYFRNPSRHSKILRRIESELERSDNDAIVRFREKYDNPFPPCWLMMEATSMGMLSTIYSELKPGGLRRKIASYYSLSDTVFSSWLHHLVYVRNACAHHSRLWNKTLSIRPVVPERTGKPFPQIRQGSASHVYFTLCIIKYLQNTVKPENTFTQRLVSLLDNYPAVDQSLMGFPSGWRSDVLWKER